jgi:hypothetical protein
MRQSVVSWPVTWRTGSLTEHSAEQSRILQSVGRSWPSIDQMGESPDGDMSTTQVLQPCPLSPLSDLRVGSPSF